MCQWLEPIIPALEQMARGSSCLNIVKPCLNIIIIITTTTDLAIMRF